MFKFVTDLVTAPAEGGTAPLADLFGVLLSAPIIYFIGLGLLGGLVGVIYALRR